MRPIESFIERLRSSTLCKTGWVQGCSESEISELEKHFNLHLPLTYKVFLRAVGRGAGKFMQGTDAFYEHLFFIRSALEEVLENNGLSKYLPIDAFVFASHQGYIFYFFETARHLEDPPVFGYMDGGSEIKEINQRLSAFLNDYLDDETGTWKGSRELVSTRREP
jgi:hypothetical protein